MALGFTASLDPKREPEAPDAVAQALQALAPGIYKEGLAAGYAIGYQSAVDGSRPERLSIVIENLEVTSNAKGSVPSLHMSPRIVAESSAKVGNN